MAGNAVVGVAPFVVMGVFSSTMQLRGLPGLEYSDAGLAAESVVKEIGKHFTFIISYFGWQQINRELFIHFKLQFQA